MKVAPVTVKTVIVTGCSTGIGLATAHLLRERGWRVIATARKASDLERLRDDGFETAALDLADEASVNAAAEDLIGRLPEGLGALVNNAGFGQVGAIEDLSRRLMAYQFEVNVIGLQHFTNRLLPVMRRGRAGRIVNISSVLGRVTLPYLGIYSASKYALEAISDALRVELRGTGIGVSIIEPGPITTAFGDNAARHARSTLEPATLHHRAYYEQELQRRAGATVRAESLALPPEAVARKILHALEHPRPRRRYQVTLPAYAGALLARLAPASLIDWIMAHRTKA